MTPLLFLFGLTISCILVWGAGAETPHYTWRSKQGTVPVKGLQRAVEQFVCTNTQSREDQEERHRKQEAQSTWKKCDPSVNCWASRASGWHTTLLAVAGVTFLSVVRCCHRLLDI